jgi:MFS family permease
MYLEVWSQSALTAVDDGHHCLHVCHSLEIRFFLAETLTNIRVCGANSDLFGRRWFIVGGNVILFVGFIVGGSARNNTAMLAAMSLIGFGAGNAQLAAFALPELLPNKWRPAAVVLADVGVYFAVVVGPVAGRFAGQNGDTVSLEVSHCTTSN